MQTHTVSYWIISLKMDLLTGGGRRMTAKGKAYPRRETIYTNEPPAGIEGCGSVDPTVLEDKRRHHSHAPQKKKPKQNPKTNTKSAHVSKEKEQHSN